MPYHQSAYDIDMRKVIDRLRCCPAACRSRNGHDVVHAVPFRLAFIPWKDGRTDKMTTRDF